MIVPIIRLAIVILLMKLLVKLNFFLKIKARIKLIVVENIKASQTDRTNNIISIGKMSTDITIPIILHTLLKEIAPYKQKGKQTQDQIHGTGVPKE